MELSKIALMALSNAKKAHDELGEKGLQKTQHNAFGDLALVCDWACEEAVIETLRREKVPIRIISEEHGKINLVRHPQLLGILDGIDGTSGPGGYKEARGTGRYATMLGIFRLLEPTYQDFVFNGSIELAEEARLYLLKNN